jgi:tRNA pseudouridine55 synthase
MRLPNGPRVAERRPHGWLILDKPMGMGSTQAVAAVKRNLREAGYGKVKVGHGGTLDPLASGVLPIALGEATKLCGRMLDSDKVYEFTIHLGTETDTLDAEGEVVATSDVLPSLTEIEAVLPRFTGAIEQVPPAFSALKVDGKRAYDRARAGEEVELKARAVTIHSLSTRHPRESGDPVATLEPGSRFRGNDETLDMITLEAHVSKGTYIRSLARDLAHALGTVGHVTMLRRTKAGPFALEQAISLDKLNAIGKGARLEDVILPLEAGLDGIPALSLSPEAAEAVRQGRVLSGLPQGDGLYWASAGDSPIALMQLTAGTAKVVRGFNL